VIREPFIFLLISPDFFLLAILKTAMNLFLVVVKLILTLEGEKLFGMPDILRIGIIEIAFTERQIINGIQQIGFANSIVPDKAIQFPGESEGGFTKILIIQHRKLPDKHVDLI
jgi:hypothetical protein